MTLINSISKIQIAPKEFRIPFLGLVSSQLMNGGAFFLLDKV